MKRRVVSHFSYISLILGMLLMFWSFYPVISFELYSRLFMQSNTVSPVPTTDKVSSLKEAGSTLGSYDVYSNNLRDFTQASLWFPSRGQKNDSSNFNIKNYYISIPKLNITRAHVVVEGEDLSKAWYIICPKACQGNTATLPSLAIPLCLSCTTKRITKRFLLIFLP